MALGHCAGRRSPSDAVLAVLVSGARCGLIAAAFEETFTGRADLGRARTAPRDSAPWTACPPTRTS
ncbi:hypothetical protein [Streptomyces klenkii]